MRVAFARNWPDQWWKGPLGPEAYVVETALRPTNGPQVEDLEPIMGLAIVAWCGEHEIHTRKEPIPDLVLGCGPDGTYLASVHSERWENAVRQVLSSRAAEVGGPRNGVDNRSHTYVGMHLAGSSIEPWGPPVVRACSGPPTWTGSTSACMWHSGTPRENPTSSARAPSST